jgi:hypothetical protein
VLRIEQTPPNGGWQTGAIKFVKYLNSKSDEILLGFEYENQSSKASTTPETPKNYVVNWEHIATNDRGGGVYGWEYKSPVAPLFLHKLQVKAFRRLTPFNTQPNGKKNNGGIHVNIERNSATAPHADTVFQFLHRDFPNTQLRKLSGRSDSSFNEFCNQNNSEWDWGMYYGVITSRKSYAYELRLFAAHPDLILPSLEMGDSLFRMAQETDEITMESYRNYLNQPQYKNLAAHWDKTLAA